MRSWLADRARTGSLLVFAARRDHIAQVIAPALARGDVVLSDRFTDATFAYQGAGRSFDRDVLLTLERWVQAGTSDAGRVDSLLQPDLTFWFDLPAEMAAERLAANSANSGMMLITGVSMLVAIGVCVLPWPDRLVAPLGVVLATLAAPLGAALSSSISLLPAAVVGALGGTVIVCFRRLVLADGGPRKIPAILAIGSAPIMASGALVYFLEKLLLR